MADKLLTLLDISKRNGTDQSVGLVEEVTTVAPELDVIMGRPISGTTYKTRIRKTLPAGPAFRQANAGTPIVSSVYDQKLSQCFIFDAQLQTDQAVADAPEEGGREMLLADEAAGVIREKAIALGDQFYRGTDADAKGFQGLQAFYDSTNMEVDATGSTGSVKTSCWIVWNNLQGVHFIFGNNTGLQMGQWRVQQVGSAGSYYTAYVNNMYGWIGLSMNHSKSVCRIKNLDNTTSGKTLTDSLISQALQKFPLQILNSGQLVIFMNRVARGQLQRSRSVTIFSGMGSKATSAYDAIAPIPTESLGIPIVCTDSILNTE